MNQSTYVLLIMSVIILVISFFCGSVEAYENRLDSSTLTNFDALSNEAKKVEFMKELEEREYIDLDNSCGEKDGYFCTICGSGKKKNLEKPVSEADKNVVEGFIGTGPGEYNVPEDPVTGNECCPSCYKPVLVNGKNKCQQVCTNGSYQDYSCLSEEAFKKMMFGDEEERDSQREKDAAKDLRWRRKQAKKLAPGRFENTDRKGRDRKDRKDRKD